MNIEKCKSRTARDGCSLVGTGKDIKYFHTIIGCK